VACRDPFLDTTYIEQTNEDLQLSNAEFLTKYEDRYSLWIELLKYANLYNALNDAVTNSTVFAPNNSAMTKFLEWKGVSSVQELDKEYARYVAQVHIIKDKISESDFINYVEAGSVPKKTLFNTYLTTSYGFKNLDVDDKYLDDVVLEDEYSIYINNQAKVANLGRAIETLNGMVYTMEDVIHPLSESVVDMLRTYREYNIFIEALEKTGYDKVVSVYADSVLNLDGTTSVTDVRFTCFATPDEVYNRNGINSVDDLIAYLRADADYTNPNNALYRYLAYHFMSRAYTKEELCAFEEEGQTLIYDMKLPGQVIIIGDGNPPIINKEATFVRSNIKARNGIIHRIDHILPVYEPEPVKVIWDFCDSPDIISFVNAYGAANGYGDLYSTPLANREYAIDLSREQKTGDWGTITSFEYKSTDTKSSSTTYHRVGFLKTSYVSSTQKDVCKYGALKHNLLMLNLGYLGYISMQTPTIIKGKYKVVFYYAGSPSLSTFYTNGSSVRFNLDDYQKSVYVWKSIPGSFVDDAKKENKTASGIAADVLWDNVVFEESGVHSFKATMMDIQAKTSSLYRQMWDYIEFIPVN